MPDAVLTRSTELLGAFVAGYVRASGRADVAPVGLWSHDEPWLEDVRRRLAPGRPVLRARETTAELELVLGVPPWGWHPSAHELGTPAAPLTVCDDPANAEIVRACRRLTPDGLGIFVVSPGFALRPGERTAFPVLARLGITPEALVQLPRGLFRPDSGTGRWLMAFSPRRAAAPVAGSLTEDPGTRADLLSAVRERTAALAAPKTPIAQPHPKEHHAHQPPRS